MFWDKRHNSWKAKLDVGSNRNRATFKGYSKSFSVKNYGTRSKALREAIKHRRWLEEQYGDQIIDKKRLKYQTLRMGNQKKEIKKCRDAATSSR